MLITIDRNLGTIVFQKNNSTCAVGQFLPLNITLLTESSETLQDTRFV